MIVRAVITICLMFSSTAANSREFTILGSGTLSCGHWTQERQNKSAMASFHGAWVLGYLTATNAYLLQHSADVSEGTDNEGVFQLA
jgi:hypothetical protein